jgi:hypothetical protein
MSLVRMVYMVEVQFGLSNRIIEPTFSLVSQGVPQMNQFFQGDLGRLRIRSIQDGGFGFALRANAVSNFVSSGG